MGATDDFNPLHTVVGFGASSERDKFRLVRSEDDWYAGLTVSLCLAVGFLLVVGLVAWRVIFKG